MQENKQDDKHKEMQRHGFSSNPAKSFEAGEKGGEPKATPLTNQATNTSKPNTGPANTLGSSDSRLGNQNKPTQGEGWQSRTAGSEETGKKDAAAE